MKPCGCWSQPINVWHPTCYAEHCCFRTEGECHDDVVAQARTDSEEAT